MSQGLWLRPGLPAATLTAALLLAGCGGSPIGNGVGPVSIGLAAATGTEVTVQGVTRVYQCFTGGVAATLFFSDGTSGNFTNRVRWSSSNPGVVQVSNGDIAAPDGSGLYAPGTLVPVAPGAATVFAEYSSINAQMTVSVGVPNSFVISSVNQGIPIPVTDISLGAGTSQQFVVSAITDGVSKDVSSFARWTIGGSIASVTAAGVVSALGAGGPTPLTASFLNCNNTVSTNLKVANILDITTAPEFGTDPLLLGNSEKINVLADLDDGSRQDVSQLSALTSTDTSIATFATAAGANNILQPITGGPVTVQATLNNTYTAPDQIVNVITSTLTGLSVTPAAATLRAGSNQVVYFKALGTFQNGQTQDITRSVTWAVANATLATISNAGATAGFAAANPSLVGQTTVTATPLTTDSTATVDGVTLTVDSVANPASP